MSLIKEKLKSAIQKIIVIILACLLGLCVLPVGLIPDKEPEDMGDFIRFFAQDEKYPQSLGAVKGIENIGRGNSAFLRFNLEELFDTNVDEIKSVRLRLAFLKGSGEMKNDIEIVQIPNNIWQKADGIATPFFCGERKIALIHPQTKSSEDSLSEIDITEIVKEGALRGEYSVDLCLRAEMSVPVHLATGEFYDSAYRPYIKVVTGEAQDKDAYSYRRARLSEAVYVSKMDATMRGIDLVKENQCIVAGGGNEIYLKFELNENSIFDTVYSARLSLCKKSGIKDSRLMIYCVNNNQWSGDNISYGALPRGEESIAAQFVAGDDGRVNIDITGAVCEARSLGIKSLTLRIVGDEDLTGFYGMEDERRKPALYIKATDDKNIGCAAEAALNALGVNSASFVTMNLSASYRAQDGTDAKIRWREYDENGREITGRHISQGGEITRPKWFEDSANVVAEAKIRSGDYVTSRRYYVTVPSSATPDYSNRTFGNYIDIGNRQSEEDHLFDSINISAVRRRWTSGRMFTYRVPDIDGRMLLNLGCVPEEDNYITLKLWEGDKQNDCEFTLSVCDEERKTIVLKTPDDGLVHDKGFVYATYKLPKEFTEGKSYVSLCLSARGKTLAEDDQPEFEGRGIYAAYVTQSAFFEPKEFVKQGEKAISEPYFGEDATSKFIRNLRAMLIPVNVRDVAERTMSLDKDNGVAVFTGEELNIAFAVDNAKQTAQIYQKTEYYDRYCEGCRVSVDKELVVVDFGDYKLLWNMSETEAAELPYRRMEMSGVYKDAEGNYYTFSEEWQMTDDSVIPEGEIVHDGREIVVKPDSAILLAHISNPLHESDWRVNKINGKNVSEFVFDENETVRVVTVKEVGGTSLKAEKLTVVFAVYDNDKLASVHQKMLKPTDSIDMYSIDFSDCDISLKKGRSIRVFVYDSEADMTEIAPKLELP